MTTTWQEYRKKVTYPPLEEDIEADVCVVGGGMAGVLTAYRLANEGKRVVLLEKRELASYATAMTTAFITKVIDSPLEEIADIFSPAVTKAVASSGQAAIEEFARIVKEEGLDCEFVRCSNFSYASSDKDFKKLEKEASLYRRYSIPATLVKDGAGLNFENAGYLEVPKQAKFHPTKFLFGLAERAARSGVRIFEHTEALSIENGKPLLVETKRGAVRATDVVIATYKPTSNKSTHLKKAMYRSYVLEAQVPRDLFREGLYEDQENPYHYFRIDAAAGRNDYDRLIIGGEDHKDIFGNPPVAHLGPESFKAVGAYLGKLMGKRRYWIVRKWSGPILEPSDGLPLIGRIAPHRYVATGFSGNGMTYSMIASMICADLILKRKNAWTKAYDPTRSLIHPKRLGTKAADYVDEFVHGALKNLLS
jgi:glycine/D-amino acid oxidase-like deaminating enzyme